MRLIGSFHTITIHGTSGTVTSPTSGRSTSTGAVVATASIVAHGPGSCGFVRPAPPPLVSPPSMAMSAQVALVRPGHKARVGGFVALTKPRIIELLLVTTL